MEWAHFRLDIQCTKWDISKEERQQIPDRFKSDTLILHSLVVLWPRHSTLMGSNRLSLASRLTGLQIHANKRQVTSCYRGMCLSLEGGCYVCYIRLFIDVVLDPVTTQYSLWCPAKTYSPLMTVCSQSVHCSPFVMHMVYLVFHKFFPLSFLISHSLSAWCPSRCCCIRCLEVSMGHTTNLLQAPVFFLYNNTHFFLSSVIKLFPFHMICGKKVFKNLYYVHFVELG